jgi:adenosine/AMP kinase
MPRVGPSITGTASATATATPIPTSRLRQWWDNGNLLIGFGWTLFGVLLLDRYLQYSEGMNVESVVGIVEEEARQKRFELLEKHRNDPTLFKCAVRKIYKMGGSHSLMHVELNDVIEVLQEGVGPDQVYNLCRKMNTLDTGVNGQQQQQQVLSIGWYPIQYLEKVREPKKSRWAFWK